MRYVHLYFTRRRTAQYQSTYVHVFPGIRIQIVVIVRAQLNYALRKLAWTVSLGIGKESGSTIRSEVMRIGSENDVQWM